VQPGSYLKRWAYLTAAGHLFGSSPFGRRWSRVTRHASRVTRHAKSTENGETVEQLPLARRERLDSPSRARRGGPLRLASNSIPDLHADASTGRAVRAIAGGGK
jgi:hypothetical protein